MARFVSSSYLIQDGKDSISLHTRSEIQDEKRTGSLIGFELYPDPSAYNKFVILTGGDCLEGVILPDVSLLVKVIDLYRGNFRGIYVRRENRLRLHSRAERNGKNTQIFLLEKCRYEGFSVDEDTLAIVRKVADAENWKSAQKLRAERQKAQPASSKDLDKGKKIKDGKSVKKEDAKKRPQVEKKKIREDLRDEKIEGKLEYKTKDLFQEKELSAICHCISADASMSKGFAKVVASIFPDAKRMLIEDRKPRMGETVKIGEKPIRFHMVTKDTDKPKISNLVRCLRKLAIICDREDITALQMPRIGSGLDQLEWSEVKNSINLEQLSRFMGHSLNTHCQFYRLPDNVYQTAKVSKLLILMSEGGADKYKGKTLDDIDINLDAIECEVQPFEEALESKHLQEDNDTENQTPLTQNESQNNIRNNNSQKRPKRSRITWTTQEKRTISSHFAKNIKNKEAPKKAEVDGLIEKYPHIFKDKSWNLIKAVVYNIYKGNLKVK